MILTAHQPVYLPWLGLFHKIALADTFVFFSEVQYVPKDYIQRNKIKMPMPHGPIWLTVPVLDKGYREKRISQMEINNSLLWRRKHWGSIVASYKKAPYFDLYAPFLENTYEREWKYLADLNEYLLKWLLDALGIKVRFLKASDFDFQGTKSDLVLNMCKQLGADYYIFGAMGRSYAKVEDFENAGTKVVFQEYKHPTYPQLHGDFVPYLSVIDLLFNCGPRSLEIVLSGQDPLPLPKPHLGDK